MKKWIYLLFIALILVTLLLVWIFRPPATLYHEEKIRISQKSMQRALWNDENWQKWWPGTTPGAKGDAFLYNGFRYVMIRKDFSLISFSIEKENFSADAVLSFAPLTRDSMDVRWVARPTENTLLDKIRSSRVNRQLDRDLGYLLEKLKMHVSNTAHIYNFNIQPVLVVDSMLISTSKTFTAYPTTEQIYTMISDLKGYIRTQQAMETGFPMLNVTTSDSIHYLTRVALPVNRELHTAGDIVYKRMLGRGNILVTEVKGGPGRIKEAFGQMKIYMEDYQRSGVAIPFQSIITDRSKEPDTSKWVTKVYFPVI